MGDLQRNQEMDVILLAKQKKFIVIEVKSGHSDRVIPDALSTLKQAKTFADYIFKIIGIPWLECWEYIPLVALPNVESRDKIHKKYCSQLEYQTELKTDLAEVIQLDEPGTTDGVYNSILQLLAASYHVADCKNDDIEGLKFMVKNLALGASTKLTGKSVIQPGFDPGEEIQDTVSLGNLKFAPLAGFKGIMFWNKQQLEILMNMEKQEKEGTPFIIAGAWGTGKTLLLVYKVVNLSRWYGKESVVFISNLDSSKNAVDPRHFVFEESLKLYLSERNILFLTMKDVINKTEEPHQNSKSLLLHFIRQLAKDGIRHILIDELSCNPSLLAELHEIKLNSCSLTVAIQGKANNLEELQLNEERTIVLKTIMRTSKAVYEAITNLENISTNTSKIYMNSTLHTVLGLKPKYIRVSRRNEGITFGLKKALDLVTAQPSVVTRVQKATPVGGTVQIKQLIVVPDQVLCTRDFVL